MMLAGLIDARVEEDARAQAAGERGERGADREAHADGDDRRQVELHTAMVGGSPGGR